MRRISSSCLLIARTLIVLGVLLRTDAHSAGPVLIAYAGVNETAGPLWVGIEMGLFRKYGVDPRMLLVRSGPLLMVTLASGGAPVVWVSPSSTLSAALGGLKIACFASGSNRIPRELVVRKGIESTDDLRGKTFGVQSIGGSFWFQTMAVLDGLGIDPEKYKLNMRVVGDTGTVTQALIAGNVDAAVLPYSFSGTAKRADARSLVNTGEMKLSYQGNHFCAQRSFISESADTMIALTKGLVDALVYILESAHKPEVKKVLKKNLRFSKDEEAEASYTVLRALMMPVDIAPNFEAWRAAKRIVARINPKVQEADLDQILSNNAVKNLEESGFLPEMRKKLP